VAFPIIPAISRQITKSVQGVKDNFLTSSGQEVNIEMQALQLHKTVPIMPEVVKTTVEIKRWAPLLTPH